MMAIRWLACFTGAASVLFGQAHSGCDIPKDAIPSGVAVSSAAWNNEAGAWFAKRGNARCAISYFEASLRLDPRLQDARYNLGLALFEDRQLARAAKELELAVRQTPGSMRARLALGAARQDLGDLAGAETQFREAVQFAPDSPEALHYLGGNLIEQKRYTAAAGYLRAAMSLDAGDPSHAVALAEALFDNNSQAEATELLRKTVSAQPRSVLAHAGLGTLLARQKLYDEAVGHFEAALSLDESADSIRMSLVKALVALDRQQDALAPVNRVLSRHPSDPDALALRGLIYRGLAEYAKAADDLKIATRIAPDLYQAQYNYGFVLARLDNLEEARQHLEKARQLEPDSEEAQFQLATVLRRLGESGAAKQQLSEFEQRKKQGQLSNIAAMAAGKANKALAEGDAKGAADGYREALKSDVNNARTWYNLALAQQRLGDNPGAMASLERAVKTDPGFVMAHNQLGLLYMATARNSDANREFVAAIGKDPQCAECQNNLGVLAGQLGDRKRAEELFRQAIENSTDYGQARVNLALLLAGRGDFGGAQQELAAALAKEPGNTKALTALGMIQGRTGNAAAPETFRKVVSLDPGSADAHLNLGIALADRHDTENALKEFGEAVRLAPESAATHYNKGRLLGDLKRFDEAIPELREACRLEPGLADGHYRLGLAERETGNNAAASTELTRALELDPRNAGAAYLLGQSLQGLGKTTEAVEAWRKALALDPNNTQALYSLMRASQTTDPKQAEQYQAKLKALQKQKGLVERAEALGNQGIAAARQGDWDKALSQMREAIDVCAGCSSLPGLRKNLGLTECQAGRFAACEKDLREALTELPGDAEIGKALGILAGMKGR